MAKDFQGSMAFLSRNGDAIGRNLTDWFDRNTIHFGIVVGQNIVRNHERRVSVPVGQTNIQHRTIQTKIDPYQSVLRWRAESPNEHRSRVVGPQDRDPTVRLKRIATKSHSHRIIGYPWHHAE